MSDTAKTNKFSFSKSSLQKLQTADYRLQLVMHHALEMGIIDFSVLEGHRGKAEQNADVAKGTSELKFPKSKHNADPALAVDIAPYPIDWDDMKRFLRLHVVILVTSIICNVPLRWGGNWDGKSNNKKTTLDDTPHYEIIETRPFTNDEQIIQKKFNIEEAASLVRFILSLRGL